MEATIGFVNPLRVVFKRIIVREYDFIFGPRDAVAMRYDENLVRTDAHYSDLFSCCFTQRALSLHWEEKVCLYGSGPAGIKFLVCKRVRIR